MESITYSQVQDLARQLPPRCLPAAYAMLHELRNQNDASESRADFLRLPLSQRHEILARQAEELKAYYVQTADERSDWQAGDFMDESPTG